MNKIKKYSLEQLTKVHPLLNESEMLCILGGFEKEDETYYYFLAREIRQMFPSGNIPSSFESYWEREDWYDGTGSYTLIHYYRITKENYHKLYGSDSSDIISNSNESSGGDQSSSEDPNTSSESSSESSEASEISDMSNYVLNEFVNRIYRTILSTANKSSVSSIFENQIKNAIRAILNQLDEVSGLNIVFRQIQQKILVTFTDRTNNNKIGEFTIDFLEEKVE